MFFREKIKLEKIPLEVGHDFEKILTSLAKPLKLNDMRPMKEPNYSAIRRVIRDPRKMGDQVLAKLAESCDEIGISRNSFNLIYESFWDLYCKKPQTSDLSVKKLDGWLNNFRLSVPTWEGEEEQAEDDEQPKPAQANKGLPVKAVVRVRIPFKREEEKAEPGSGGEEMEKVETKSAKSGKSKKSSKI